MYDDLIAAGSDPLYSEVPPRLQSHAAYQVSANWHQRVASEYDYGESLKDFLTGLTKGLRLVQLADLPAPAHHKRRTVTGTRISQRFTTRIVNAVERRHERQIVLLRLTR